MKTPSVRARIIAPVTVFVVALAIWQVLASSGVMPSFALPQPGDVLARLWSDVSRGIVVPFIWPTLTAALLGTAFGAIVGLPLGYFVAKVPWVRAALEPYIAMSQAIPLVALAPIVVIWFGFGTIPIAILAAIITFFPIVTTTILGFVNVDEDVREAARLDGANEWRLLMRIELPLASSFLVAGLRGALALSLIGAIVGEFVMGGRGLGMLLILTRDGTDTTGLFAAVLLIAIIASVLFALVTWLERALARRYGDLEVFTRQRREPEGSTQKGTPAHAHEI